MRIALVPGQPRYRVPRPAIAAAVALVALGLTVAAIPGHEAGPVVCPFRAATGLPCPTCGTIRATGLLLRGRFDEAFRTNPLSATTVAVVAPLLLGLWIANAGGGWALRMKVNSSERRLLWAVAGLALILNWVYVLVAQAG